MDAKKSWPRVIVHGPRIVVYGRGHQPGRKREGREIKSKRKRTGGRFAQALAILTSHLAGCGVGAPPILRRECRRAWELFSQATLKERLQRDRHQTKSVQLTG